MIVCPYNLNIIYLDIFYGIKLLCSILFQKPLKYRIVIARTAKYFQNVSNSQSIFLNYFEYIRILREDYSSLQKGYCIQYFLTLNKRRTFLQRTSFSIPKSR